MARQPLVSITFISQDAPEMSKEIVRTGPGFLYATIE